MSEFTNKFFEDKAVGALWDVAVSIKRGNPLPLDKDAVVHGIDELNAIASGAVSYPGQIIAVVEDAVYEGEGEEAVLIKEEQVTLYYLDHNKQPREVGKVPVGDDLSVEVEDEKISLHDFGKAFYKYIAEVKDEEGNVTSEAKYEKVEVSDENPWKAGLEPKVVTEEGQLVIGWFEPNPTTIEGVNDQVVAVQGTVADLEKAVGVAGGEGIEATGLYKEIDDVEADVVTVKEDVKSIQEALNGTDEVDGLIERVGAVETGLGNVYTKSETEGLINSAGHLKRQIVETLPAVEDADKDTIYMVLYTTSLSGNNLYEEFMLIGDDTNGYKFEKIGDTRVDLTDYAKTADVNKTLEDYAKSADVNKTLEDYAKTADVNATLEDYAKTADIQNALNLAGTALQPGDITSGAENGTIAVEGQDVQVTGLGSAAYKNEGDFDASGSASQALTDAKAHVAEELAKEVQRADGAYDTKGSASDALDAAKAHTDEKVGAPASEGKEATGIYSQVYTKSETYAKSDLYTKEEIDTNLYEGSYQKGEETIASNIAEADREASRLISPEEIAKLSALVLDEDGSVGVSGTISADNVTGLAGAIENTVTGSNALGIERGAQVNKIEAISIEGSDLEITEKRVALPLALASKAGLVRSAKVTEVEGVQTTAENSVSVDAEGYMFVNSLNVSKLVQTEGDWLILNDGNASLTIKNA